jgi:Holliday junction resolvasome RuvABC endonuclease subunit
MILSLDLGTTTGWATGAAGILVSGVWNLKGSRYEGGGMRFLRFHGFLVGVHLQSRVSKVVYEEVRRHAGTDAAHVYGGLQAVLTSWAEEGGIPYESVPVGTIKKFWTGKGNANKEAMVAEAERRGIEVSGHDEADAVALLTWAMEGAG